ncbi:MAG TPA: hypothetical protein VGA56_00055 [Opitutaceae bacterium]
MHLIDFGNQTFNRSSIHGANPVSTVFRLGKSSFDASSGGENVFMREERDAGN